MSAYEEKHFTKTRFLFEANDLVPGYRNDQSNDRYPTLWKIQLDEADGKEGLNSGKQPRTWGHTSLNFDCRVRF